VAEENSGVFRGPRNRVVMVDLEFPYVQIFFVTTVCRKLLHCDWMEPLTAPEIFIPGSNCEMVDNLS